MTLKQLLAVMFLSAISSSAYAESAAKSSTSAKSLILSFQLKLGFEAEVGGESQPDEGIFRPDAVKVFSVLSFSKSIGLFVFSQVGRARGETLAGLHFRPLALFENKDWMNLEAYGGSGIGVGGVPIFGGGISFEAEDRVLLRMYGHYHSVTGIYQDMEACVRVPKGFWIIEPWIGVKEKMSGKLDNIFDTAEAGLILALVIRAPAIVRVLSFFPLHSGVENVKETRFTIGIEIEVWK